MSSRRKFTTLRLEELEARWVPSAVATTSTNWSGYAVQAAANSVTSVSGSWVVPTAATTTSGYSAVWVGIDGYNSSTVEQLGTETDFVNGKAQYYAWYEMYPSGSVNLNLAVNPGDKISASVNYGSKGYTLSITDTPRSGAAVETFTTTQKATAQRSSAEWVVEAPSSYSGVLPLANFGTVSFSNAHATINGTSGSITTAGAGSQIYQIGMISQRGASEDTTSGVDATGSNFTTTYTAATLPTPPPPPPRHHWGWWWEPNVAAAASTPQTATPAATTATTTATASPLAVASLPVGGFTLPPAATLPAPQTPLSLFVSPPALPSFVVTGPTTAARFLATTSSALGGGSDNASAPQIPDAWIAPDAPGLLQSRPESAFSPRDEGAAGLLWSRADRAHLSDACFTDWTTGNGAGSEEAWGEMSNEAQGLALALALGAAWGIDKQATPRRRLLRRG